ncbi:norphogenetic protein, partial [Escherichia coli]
AGRWTTRCGCGERENESARENSALGVVNLAFKIGYKHVALVGVDDTKKLRVHSGGTQKNLSHLLLLFPSALEQIDVVSCGKMGGIPQMTLKEWLKNT